MDYRFGSYEDFLKGLADLAGNIRQASIRSKQARQMSMASHIVDVLNNKVNDTSNISTNVTELPSKPSNENLAASASLKTVNPKAKSANSKIQNKQQMGYAESNIDGNLALSVDTNEKSENSNNNKTTSKLTQKTTPKLRLVPPPANTTVTKKSKSSEWTDEKNFLKNPFVIIGFVLAIMVLLILFW